MQLRRILKVTTLIGGVVATLLAVSTNALAAANAKSPSADELKAIQVATEFVQNMHHDACKAGTFLSDKLKWRGGPDEELKHGKESAVGFLLSFADRQSEMAKAFQINSIEILGASAHGGTRDVLVIMPRFDHGIFFGKAGTELAGGFFRVNPVTWKIEEWLDTPLNVTLEPEGFVLPPLPAAGKYKCPPDAGK